MVFGCNWLLKAAAGVACSFLCSKNEKREACVCMGFKKRATHVGVVSFTTTSENGTLIRD